MGSRSRKRGAPPAAPKPRPAAPARPPVPGPLDEFTAVAAPAPPTTAAPADAAPPATGDARPAKPKKLRGEAANEAIRARLQPLAPDERPASLLVAVAVTVLLGGGNLLSFLLGFEVDGKTPPASGVISFATIMFVMAWGMWNKRYWALLGFQALLALIVIVFALFLPTASNWEAVGVCTAVAGLGGWLFWKNVRVLSRVQMPERPGR